MNQNITKEEHSCDRWYGVLKGSRLADGIKLKILGIFN
jgi:hypothetical protein